MPPLAIASTHAGGLLHSSVLEDEFKAVRRAEKATRIQELLAVSWAAPFACPIARGAFQ